MDLPLNTKGVVTMKVSISMMKWAFALSVLLWTTLHTLNASAADPVVTRYFSGVWNQPHQANQGLMLQIAAQPDGGRVGAAYWFTYDGDLKTAWYAGVGPIEGNQIFLTLYTAFGVDFMQPANPVAGSVEEIGTLTLTFQNCNRGHAEFETNLEAVGSGDFPIRRLTKMYHSRCSGGISDDTPSDAKPVVLHVRLLPVRDDITGEAMAKFKQQADRSEFSVEAEEVTDGTYQLEVCGENRGVLEVAGGEGELEFRSPEEDGTELLTFEPEDCVIELLDTDGVALSTGDAVLGDKQTGHDKDKDDDGEETLEIEVDMDNTGIFPDGSGEAEFEIEGDHSEFKVKIKDVPIAFYPLHVDGLEVGQIEVVDQNGKLRGELKFRDPEEPGTPLLDFDPRLKTIDVLDAGDIIFTVFFPDL
jgi:hypothetical protein